MEISTVSKDAPNFLVGKYSPQKDIDIDVCPSRREAVFEETRKETGELGCVHVCTYGVLTTKAAIKCAARGYRSSQFPNGIPLEDAEYLSSLVPSER